MPFVSWKHSFIELPVGLVSSHYVLCNYLFAINLWRGETAIQSSRALSRFRLKYRDSKIPEMLFSELCTRVRFSFYSPFCISASDLSLFSFLSQRQRINRRNRISAVDSQNTSAPWNRNHRRSRWPDTGFGGCFSVRKMVFSFAFLLKLSKKLPKRFPLKC